MRKLSWTALVVAPLLWVSVLQVAAVAQQAPAGMGQPLTVDDALVPDEAMLRDAIQMVSVNTEEFVSLAEQIAAVELVDVGAIAEDSAEVERDLQDVETELSLLRVALPSSEHVAEALKSEGVAVEDVLAAQVIHGDVVSVVIYYND